MAYFIRIADTYRITPHSAVNIQEKLPAGTYAVKLDDSGYFVELIKDFKLPTRLYGDTNKHAKRIMDTFFDRPSSTGVFLEGEKGSGKTLLAKTIATKMLALGHPTLVVNSAFCGDGFNTFLQNIDQPKVVLFDEFEKVYNDNEDMNINSQERVLTLFDGVYPSKSLFIVTCNDSYRVDKNMKNRPGRMYYQLTFGGLDENFVREYAEENLHDKTNIDSIVSTSLLFRSFNFDMLQALVEEMNRYGETAQEAIKMLNAKPGDSKDSFDIKLFIGGKEMKLQRGYDTWHGSPLTGSVSFHYWPDGERNKHMTYTFEPNELKSISPESGEFVYERGEERCTLTRKKEEAYDYSHLVA